MTQLWQGDRVVPVTRVEVMPNVITQVKNDKVDGYQALQIGYGFKKAKNIAKPQRGHLLKSGQETLRYLREFRTATSDFKIGDVITADTFSPGETVNVSGVSKGKGFQGVVKRWGFHGFRKTHGNKDQERHSGSVGAKGPAHVFKGIKMGGHMGDDNVTTTNLKIVEVDVANNLLFIKGALPGARHSLLVITGTGELKVNQNVKAEEVPATVEEVKAEETKVEEIKVEEAPIEEVKTEEATQDILEK